MVSVRSFVVIACLVSAYYLLIYSLFPSEPTGTGHDGGVSWGSIGRKVWSSLKSRRSTRDKVKWRKVIERDRVRGAENIANDITSQGQVYGPTDMGKTKRILIATTWRSGSTFLSELLTSLPASFHHYEPLMQFAFADLRDPTLNELALQMVNDLFQCRYENLDDYLEFARGEEEMMGRNGNLWKRCNAIKRSLCYDRNFLERACPLFPLQIMKTVRLPLRSIEKLLIDEDLNLKVIFLVRDPRGIISSRKRVKWCNVPTCSSPRILCNTMEENFHAAQKLLEQHPERFILLRYEDLAMEPMDTSRILFDWLELPWLRQVEDFILKHTNATDKSPWGTEKAKGSRVAAWSQELNWKHVQYVQDVCTKVMEKLGYLPVEEHSFRSDITFTHSPPLFNEQFE